MGYLAWQKVELPRLRKKESNQFVRQRGRGYRIRRLSRLRKVLKRPPQRHSVQWVLLMD